MTVVFPVSAGECCQFGATNRPCLRKYPTTAETASGAIRNFGRDMTSAYSARIALVTTGVTMPLNTALTTWRVDESSCFVNWAATMTFVHQAGQGVRGQAILGGGQRTQLPHRQPRPLHDFASGVPRIPRDLFRQDDEQDPDVEWRDVGGCNGRPRRLNDNKTSVRERRLSVSPERSEPRKR